MSWDRSDRAKFLTGAQIDEWIEEGPRPRDVP